MNCQLCLQRDESAIVCHVLLLLLLLEMKENEKVHELILKIDTFPRPRVYF